MCRIAGFFNAATGEADLSEAARLLRHGGPDAAYSRRGDGWGLACRRLAVVDPCGGHQPFEAEGHVSVVFNGEIYNDCELRRELIANGYAFADRCDGSILPALYLEHGIDFVSRLDGMYALALVDLRAEPRLVLAVDDFAMKPLYYHFDERTRQLHFASEIPALLSFPEVDAPPVPEGLDDYLATKTPFGEHTMFRGVRALMPGATAVVSRSGGVRIFTRERPRPHDLLADLDEVGTTLLGVLGRETERLIQADARVCAVTSGGLDSSLVTMLASRLTTSLSTFNIAYRGEWPDDESRFARDVAQAARSCHHEVEGDPRECPGLLAEVIRHLGQPNADPITVSTYILFRAICAAGFKVALTGDAADELFSGYGRLRDAVAAPTGAAWIDAYVEALAAIPRALRERLYTSEYLHYVRSRSGVADALAERLAASEGARIDALTEMEIYQRLPAYHLRRVDHLSMAHGVEVRLVFCQRRVAQIARSLAPSMRIRGDEVKRALYRAATGVVPRSVLERPKQPFTLPVGAMMRPGLPLFEHAREVLAPCNLATQALVEPRQVSRLFATQSAAPTDQVAMAIWSLMIFELWRREFELGAGASGLRWAA